MSFFEKMNRKQKRKFNKLSPEEQAPIIEAELVQKVSPIMAKEIANSMIAGADLVWEQLYSDYVSMIDATYEESELRLRIEALLGKIRTQYLRIQSDKAKKEI